MLDLTARRRMSLHALLSPHGARAPRDVTITGLALDSRRVRSGDLFFALQGTTSSGTQHIAAAVAAGAVAVAVDAIDVERCRQTRVPCLPVADLAANLSAIAARYYGDPSSQLTVVGVTGTNGKSTVSHLVASCLDGDAQLGRCGTVGTLGFGFPPQLAPLDNTTPDPITLQACLVALQSNGARSAVCEVSSHALAQHRADAVAFDVAVLTNISRDHLDYHGSMERYVAAKRRLFEFSSLASAVINLDDPCADDMIAALHPGTRLLGYRSAPPSRTLDSAPCVYAEDIRATRTGLDVEVSTPQGRSRLTSPLIGRFNAANLLAALGVLLELEVPLATAIASLARVPSLTGRMQCLGGTTTEPLVVIDYAHTPDGLEHALATLRELTSTRLACVFGCGGDRDRGKRPLMGAIAERLCDRVIVTSDNPRSEDPARIAAEIVSGMTRPGDATVLLSRREAIASAIADAGAGDVVLIAGKGHETYQDCQGQRLPFSDVDEAARCLSGLQP